ncbi:MAG: hypothetical protein GF364_02175, partial [Candidatus Lokiarchaeota archaeon]|nr:hypothetical protein [Candidatus Lokiarchaeota archaeon]
MKHDVVYTKYSIKIPRDKWLSQFSRQFDSLSIQILSKYLIEKTRGLVLLEIKGIRTQEFISQMKTRRIAAYILSKSENQALISVRMSDPWVLKAIIGTEILLMYPISLKKGRLMIETLSEREKIDDFFSALEHHNIEFNIDRIGSYYEKPLLTSHQYKILNAAFKKGFYKIPRQINKTELAEQFG